MRQLRGKVVLIDFLTYSCINCIRTLPYVTSWYEKYKNDGLMVIGVHTPEFEFEKVTENVATAIKRHNIKYPVAQDNNFATWNAYKNRYWPAKYLIDKEGNIVYTHFGEGEYDTTENKIRFLLGLNDNENESQSRTEPQTGSGTGVKTPEIYFGTDRLEYLTPEQSPSPNAKRYQLPPSLKLNRFALEGEWKFDGEKAILINGSGKIRLKYYASDVFMVAQSEKSLPIIIRLDGDKAAEFTVQESKLYDLIKSDVSAEHVLEIEIPESGFEIFAFTFG